MVVVLVAIGRLLNRCFDYVSCSGCQKRFQIGCKERREYGYSYVPGVLTFEKNNEEFHILRFLSVRIIGDLYEDLKPTAQYRPPARAFEIPRDVRTAPGIPLPRQVPPVF